MYPTEPPLKQCGRIQIVPYHLDHFKELVVRPHEGEMKEAIKLSDTQWAKAIGREAVEAYTCYFEGEILLIGVLIYYGKVLRKFGLLVLLQSHH